MSRLVSLSSTMRIRGGVCMDCLMAEASAHLDRWNPDELWLHVLSPSFLGNPVSTFPRHALMQMFFDLREELPRAVGLGDIVVAARSACLVFIAAERV